MSVTAIFKMSFLQGKMKIEKPVPEFFVPIVERNIKVIDIGEGETTANFYEHKILVFELLRQVSKKTFEYGFKEIK